MKLCRKCGVEKAKTEFFKCAKRKDGLQSQCKKCAGKDTASYYAKNAEFLRTRAKEIRKNLGPRGRQLVVLKSEYGLTEDALKAMEESQKGRCAICGVTFSNSRTTHVDHIHDSNPIIIRGLLCHLCNLGLGLFKDSPERLLNAAAYLKKFQK